MQDKIIKAQDAGYANTVDDQSICDSEVNISGLTMSQAKKCR